MEILESLIILKNSENWENSENLANLENSDNSENSGSSKIMKIPKIKTKCPKKIPEFHPSEDHAASGW